MARATGDELSILVVEPWFGGSHAAWAQGFADHSRHRIHLLTLPDRFWRWRLRGGAVTLAEATADHVDRNGRPDAVLASSMLDLPAYLGHARRSLGGAAVCCYLHETQSARSSLTGEPLDNDAAMRNWSSMVVADHVFANSRFHRDRLFGVLPNQLANVGDHSHAHLLDGVRARTTILPVGVETRFLVEGERHEDEGEPLVLWSHRWDGDKAPEVFFRALRRLDHDGVGFRLALTGATTGGDIREFTDATERFGDRIVQAGHLGRDDYVDLLRRSSVVASTAVHEFFGVAMVEAIAAGAVPLLPDALSYPEVVPETYHEAVLYGAYGDFVRRLRETLTDLGAARARVKGLREAMLRFDWSELVPTYDTAIEDVVADRVPLDWI